MRITFLGAAGTVTGSKYLLETSTKKILVDCGLFQGHKDERLRNWQTLAFDPAELDAVLLTHAHIDHSGYLPVLVKKGFKGKIYCTPATLDLCSVLLPDSGHLQEEEAAYANKLGYSRHKPALPLYTQREAEDTLEQFWPIKNGNEYLLEDNLSFSFHRAGHILGAAAIRIKFSNRSILFSGDLGRPHDPLMNKPVSPPHADYIVIESTYGNRQHEQEDPQQQLAKIINTTLKRGGSIIIPAFAVGRTQTLLYYLYQLKKAKQIPDIPIFVDSPMATRATKLFCQYHKEHRLSLEEAAAVCKIAHYMESVEQSKQLDQMYMPTIIIAASGMATGGRILHHLRHFLPESKHTILFTGFQASGTRGAKLVNGEREIKIFGEIVKVNAQIIALNSMSAHADAEEILAWLAESDKSPKQIFITHGEVNAANALKSAIENKLGWGCIIPSYGATFNL